MQMRKKDAFCNEIYIKNIKNLNDKIIYLKYYKKHSRYIFYKYISYDKLSAKIATMIKMCRFFYNH